MQRDKKKRFKRKQQQQRNGKLPNWLMTYFCWIFIDHSITVAIYGCEAWTISKTDEKKITSFEMKCYRKILRISWTERKTNASVLEQLGAKAPQLLNLIKKQKLSYFGHIKRHNTLEKLFLEGTCEGRRGRGRPRRRWTQDIGDWMGVSIVEAGRQALERGEFRQAVWEATSIKDPP